MVTVGGFSEENSIQRKTLQRLVKFLLPGPLILKLRK
jgi:hypothetical protein